MPRVTGGGSRARPGVVRRKLADKSGRMPEGSKSKLTQKTPAKSEASRQAAAEDYLRKRAKQYKKAKSIPGAGTRVFGTGPAPRTLKERIAKSTGTTTGEARGVLKSARSAVAAGNKKQARRIVRQSLSGGPRAGVSQSAARSAKAAKVAKKYVKKTSARLSKKPPGRRAY